MRTATAELRESAASTGLLAGERTGLRAKRRPRRAARPGHHKHARSLDGGLGCAARRIAHPPGCDRSARNVSLPRRVRGSLRRFQPRAAPGSTRESGGTLPAPVSWQLRLRARGSRPGSAPLRGSATLRPRFRDRSARAERVPAGLLCSSARAQLSREALRALPLACNPPGKRREGIPRRRNARAPVTALLRRRGPRISAQRRR
jgi:hypothetical protein